MSLPSAMKLLILLLATPVGAFLVSPTTAASSLRMATSSSDDTASSSSTMKLPAELRKITTAFSKVPDDSMRHKQLLYMANQLAPIDDSQRIAENLVPGCLSTVFIDATAEWSDEKEANVIEFVGDSDGLLTKGLVALLVRGLSKSTAVEIDAVSPEFITEARIGQSLTPGRNNGFLNMLAVMKKKALEVDAKSTASDDDASNSDRPMYDGIVQALSVLQPSKLELVDNSHQHAGHSGSKGFNGESHFELEVVAEAFDGLALVKRHQLVYMLLGDIMPKIHALQISAKTSAEV